jgi:hypothetical protein
MIQVRRQKSYLARHHAVRNEVDGDDVLLYPVSKHKLLSTKNHRRSLHHLRSAAGVAGTRAAPIVRRRPDDIDESPHQTLKRNSATHGGNFPLYSHHRDPLGNRLHVLWGGCVVDSVVQGGETRLLATID